MSNSVYNLVEQSCQTLRLDLSSLEFARLAEEYDFTETQLQAICQVLEHLRQKKVDTTIHTLLKMSRLPLKDPKTFDNFDFSVIKGRDASRLKSLPSLSAIYAHRNLAFIGPAGTGKTHLAQAFGYECCQRGIKTYFIKMTELRDKFTAARRAGKEASVLNGLVRPSCLIIDEVGHCEFDNLLVRNQVTKNGKQHGKIQSKKPKKNQQGSRSLFKNRNRRRGQIQKNLKKATRTLTKQDRY